LYCLLLWKRLLITTLVSSKCAILTKVEIYLLLPQCINWLFVCLMVLSTTFKNIQLYRDGQFYWWRKLEDLKKTTDLSQVTDKLYHIMLYTSPWSRFELTTSLVIGTKSISSCKSNYYTITATTTPCINWDFCLQYAIWLSLQINQPFTDMICKSTDDNVFDDVNPQNNVSKLLFYLL